MSADPNHPGEQPAPGVADGRTPDASATSFVDPAEGRDVPASEIADAPEVAAAGHPIAGPATSARRRPLDWLKSEWAIARGKERDRWSHRRGEPRTFAFLWAIFLMLASIGALGSVVAGGVISLDSYQPLSRVLLLVVTVGVLVFWPLVRLCQERPAEGSLSSVSKDLIVLLVPLQAVVWPQMALARWSFDVVLATACALASWGLLVGAVLVLALRRDGTRRGWWMGVVLVLAIGGSVAGVATGMVSPDLTRPGGVSSAPAIVLCSGVGLVADISADRSWAGVWAVVQPQHWAAIILTSVAAMGLWTVGVLDALRRGEAARLGLAWRQFEDDAEHGINRGAALPSSPGIARVGDPPGSVEATDGVSDSPVSGGTSSRADESP